MKANELMIGDWVRMHYPFDMELDMRLERINVLAKSVDIDCEPIPLTAEILEKNGLRKVTLGGEHNSKQDYYIDTHFVGYYNMDALTRVHASPIVYDIKQKWLFVDNKETCRIELMCPYVHTLQHALRLCEIDKTIEL